MKDDVFAVLADPTRRHILSCLSRERLSVGELVEELGVSQPTVSKHLRVLREAQLVQTEAQGQKRFYSLTPEPLQGAAAWLQTLQACPAPGAEEPPSDEAREEAPTQDLPSGEAPTDKATENLPTDRAQAPEATEEEDQLPEAAAQDLLQDLTAGISFTPLAPFAPVLKQNPTPGQDDIAQLEPTQKPSLAEGNSEVEGPEKASQDEDLAEGGPHTAEGGPDTASLQSLLAALGASWAESSTPSPQKTGSLGTALLGERAEQRSQALSGQEADQDSGQVSNQDSGQVSDQVSDQDSGQALEQQADQQPLPASQLVQEERPAAPSPRPTPEPEAEERGLLAKLTRWGRRTSR